MRLNIQQIEPLKGDFMLYRAFQWSIQQSQFISCNISSFLFKCCLNVVCQDLRSQSIINFLSLMDVDPGTQLRESQMTRTWGGHHNIYYKNIDSPTLMKVLKTKQIGRLCRDLRSNILMMELQASKPELKNIFVIVLKYECDLEERDLIIYQEKASMSLYKYINEGYLNGLPDSQKIRQKTIIIVILIQACFFMHSNGLVHNDIKTANIVVFLDDSKMITCIKFIDLETVHNVFDVWKQNLSTVIYQHPQRLQLLNEYFGRLQEFQTFTLGLSCYQVISGGQKAFDFVSDLVEKDGTIKQYNKLQYVKDFKKFCQDNRYKVKFDSPQINKTDPRIVKLLKSMIERQSEFNNLKKVVDSDVFESIKTQIVNFPLPDLNKIPQTSKKQRKEFSKQQVKIIQNIMKSISERIKCNYSPTAVGVRVFVRSMDADGNGVIDLNQFKEMIKKMYKNRSQAAGISQGLIEDVFMYLDTDNSESIDRKELLKLFKGTYNKETIKTLKKDQKYLSTHQKENIQKNSKK